MCDSSCAIAVIVALVGRLFEPSVDELLVRVRRFPGLDNLGCRLRGARLRPREPRPVAFPALGVQSESRVHRVVLLTVGTVELKHVPLAQLEFLAPSGPREL